MAPAFYPRNIIRDGEVRPAVLAEDKYEGSV
jgi:hypothetical protein